jgi:HlyD family secretion protein
VNKNKSRRSLRWLWTSLLGVLIIGALVWGFQPKPIAVEVVAAKRAPLQWTVEEEGKTRVRDRFVVSASTAGYVRRLPWKAGDPVRSGDTIAYLEPQRSQSLDPRTREQNEARVAVADAALHAAEQRAKVAEEQVRAVQVDAGYWRQELERIAKLRSSGDIAAERYDRTAFDAKRAEAALLTAQQTATAARVDVETARAEIRAARASLSRPEAPSGEAIPVRAPVSGRVLRVVRQSEGAVVQGEPLLEIANARALEVEVEVLSADAVRMKPGTRVMFTRWGGDHPLEGRVRVVEPSGFTKVSALGVEEQRVRVIADITSAEEEWTRLGDGYRVEASFVLWEDRAALQLPGSAVFRYENGWAVFVIDQGKAQRRAVRIGQRSGIAVQIVEGLKEGERVVSHPDDTVNDGAEVQIVTTK